jgi:PhoH-like ATPase
MYKVLDTNILLLDANNITVLNTGSDIIVLPETVLDEIDNKKSLLDELGYQAREVGRLLTRATKLPDASIFDDDGITVIRLQLDNTEIHIVSCLSYNIDTSDPKTVNDRKIISIARIYHQKFQDTVFLTNDIMCRIRASSLAVPTDDYRQSERTQFQFLKRLEVHEDTFANIHQRSILDIDPEYLPENYNYVFTTASSEYQKPAWILDGKVQVIGKVSEEELRRQDVRPINIEQLLLAAAIQEQSIDVVIVEAASGTGKTLSALSNSMKILKRNSNYNSILYIRATIPDVPTEEEVGFLPGLEEKFAPYLHPIFDCVDYIARNRHKDSKLKGKEYEDKIEEVKTSIISDYNIQPMTTLGLRGRTFSNCIAIIDEVQNLSKSSLQKVLTRFGKDVKIILTGSNLQIDNKYLSKYTNGLSTVLNNAAEGESRVRLHVIPLTKIIRSQITEWAESIFTNKGN